MDLRRTLLADFGRDLPITGGVGQNRHDPIVLTALESSIASDTIAEVLKCIYGTLGWYWQIVQWDSVEPGASLVEKVSVTVRYALETEVVTERRSLYFDVSHVKGRSHGAQTIPTVLLPLDPKVNMPRQIGWFHFDECIDNRHMDPRLGISAAYSAPQSKMMLYAYDSGGGQADEAGSNERTRLEYQKAVADFESLNPTAVIVSEHTSGSAFVKAYELDAAFSIVLLVPLRNLCLKLRLTLEAGNETFMVECAWSTVETFIKLVSR